MVRFHCDCYEFFSALLVLVVESEPFLLPSPVFVTVLTPMKFHIEFHIPSKCVCSSSSRRGHIYDPKETIDQNWVVMVYVVVDVDHKGNGAVVVTILSLVALMAKKHCMHQYLEQLPLQLTLIFLRSVLCLLLSLLTNL